MLFRSSENFIRGFLTQCLELKFEIPRLQGAYKGLISGGCWKNKTVELPCKKEEEEKEKEKEKEETKEEETSCSYFKNKDIYNIYEQCGFGLLNQTLIDMIDADIEIYTKEWVTDAMKEAVRQNKYKYSYVEGILRCWKADGRESKRGADSKCIEDPNREGIGFELGCD